MAANNPDSTEPRKCPRCGAELPPGTPPELCPATIAECPAPMFVGKQLNGIYQLEGSTLRLTGNAPGDPAVPSDFDQPNGRKFVLKKR